jgi:CheY-like chemotaxis protein
MIQYIVLISNDSATVNSFMEQCRRLQVRGRVIQSTSGLLEKLYQQSPDLVIIDFVLEDINGGSLCHQIKCDKRLHNLPVMLLTEYNDLQRFATKFGCSQILNKPLNVSEFLFLTEMVPEMQNS